MQVPKAPAAGVGSHKFRHNVLPCSGKQGGHCKLYRPSGVPERRKGQNPERYSPGKGYSRRTPRQSHHKQQKRYRSLDEPPAEPPVRSSDGKVNATVGVVDEHDSDAGPKESKDSAG